MSEISELTQKLIAFRDARDWKQFHNPKDLAVALSIESAEAKDYRESIAIRAECSAQKVNNDVRNEFPMEI